MHNFFILKLRPTPPPTSSPMPAQHLADKPFSLSRPLLWWVLHGAGLLASIRIRLSHLQLRCRELGKRRSIRRSYGQVWMRYVLCCISCVKCWVFEDQHSLQKKGAGQGIHQSEMICLTVGWLKDTSQSLEYRKNYDRYWTEELFIKQVCCFLHMIVSEMHWIKWKQL